MLNWLRTKMKRNMNGLLVGWLVFDPTAPEPNLFVNMHPDLQTDEFLLSKIGEIADHMRTYYSDWEG